MTDSAIETNKTGGDSDPFLVCRKSRDFRDHIPDHEERGNAQLYRSGAMGRKPQTMTQTELQAIADLAEGPTPPYRSGDLIV